ncbi:MAG: hypothetical protein WCF92_03195 [bacterium]
MEKIKEEPTNFERNNLMVWIGKMNGKRTAWVGTEKDNVTLVYKVDFENKNQAIDYIKENLEKLSQENVNLDNLSNGDIKVIEKILKEGEDKVKTRDILIN